ncbi:MAG: hypothetical protein HY670_03215 [Chloroflexi bacterium]|nr:hypothetical protein [Chloroflexota bacterium]
MKEGFLARKQCPKCGGNIYLDRDYYGWFEWCLQCGHARELAGVVAGKAEVGLLEHEEAEQSAEVQQRSASEYHGNMPRHTS